MGSKKCDEKGGSLSANGLSSCGGREPNKNSPGQKRETLRPHANRWGVVQQFLSEMPQNRTPASGAGVRSAQSSIEQYTPSEGVLYAADGRSAEEPSRTGWEGEEDGEQGSSGAGGWTVQ